MSFANWLVSSITGTGEPWMFTSNYTMDSLKANSSIRNVTQPSISSTFCSCHFWQIVCYTGNLYYSSEGFSIHIFLLVFSEYPRSMDRISRVCGCIMWCSSRIPKTHFLQTNDRCQSISRCDDAVLYKSQIVSNDNSYINYENSQSAKLSKIWHICEIMCYIPRYARANRKYLQFTCAKTCIGFVSISMSGVFIWHMNYVTW